MTRRSWPSTIQRASEMGWEPVASLFGEPRTWELHKSVNAIEAYESLGFVAFAYYGDRESLRRQLIDLVFDGDVPAGRWSWCFCDDYVVLAFSDEEAAAIFRLKLA